MTAGEAQQQKYLTVRQAAFSRRRWPSACTPPWGSAISDGFSSMCRKTARLAARPRAHQDQKASTARWSALKMAIAVTRLPSTVIRCMVWLVRSVRPARVARETP